MLGKTTILEIVLMSRDKTRAKRLGTCKAAICNIFNTDGHCRTVARNVNTKPRFCDKLEESRPPVLDTVSRAGNGH